MHKPIIIALILSAGAHIAAGLGVSLIPFPRTSQIMASAQRISVEFFRTPPPEPAESEHIPVAETAEKVVTTVSPSDAHKVALQPEHAVAPKPQKPVPEPLDRQEEAPPEVNPPEPIVFTEPEPIVEADTVANEPEQTQVAARGETLDISTEGRDKKTQTVVSEAYEGFRLIDLPTPLAELAKPRYPRIASKLGYEGRAMLMVQLNEKGEVINVTVDKTSGYKILDIAAVKTAKKRWHFQPQYVNGKAIQAEFLVPVTFMLN